jgi:hypothetical protein
MGDDDLEGLMLKVRHAMAQHFLETAKARAQNQG